MKQGRRGREFWARLSAEIDDGGTISEVAQRWKVKPKTLTWWRWQLGRASRSAPRARRQLFLPVVATPVVPVASSVEVHLDGIKIVVEAGTNVKYVSELVAALRAC